MIQLKDSKGNKYSFEITKFPDGTSQVWKVNPEPARMTSMEILWMFENEAELFHVCQLSTLLYDYFKCFVTVNMPYLVGGRQDKPVTNNSTFSKDVVINLLSTCGVSKIKTYDAHSESSYVQSEEPRDFMNFALQDSKADVICFPDRGAKERYAKLFNKDTVVIYANKKRNQETGVIEGLELELNGLDLRNCNILVADDICDFGGTFIGIAKILKECNPKQLNLAISHGLFSGGLDKLKEIGYNNLYTTNSLLRNSTDRDILKVFNIL